MTTTVLGSATAGALRKRAIKLAERITTPLVPADYLDLIDPLRSGNQLRGRITAVRQETRDSATIVIRPGRGWRHHTAGQYVRIGIDVDGVRQWRAYSITSATDSADGNIGITVKAIPGGTVSNHLVHGATAGTIVQLDQAAGDFIVDAPVPTKLLFVTAGSGITPVIGMLRSMKNAANASDIVVVHSSATANDVIFGDELRTMASAGRIRLIEIHTATDGRLDIARLRELVRDIAERHTWACGPGALLDTLEQHWAAEGLADQLHTERFTIPMVGGGEGGPVNFVESGITVDTDSPTTLLDAGENAGVLMPSGCRMGVCFGCVVPLRNGAVRDVRNGEVTVGAPDAGVLVQTCVSIVAGSCELGI
jgi:ferredoxin-NADP reductase